MSFPGWEPILIGAAGVAAYSATRKTAPADVPKTAPKNEIGVTTSKYTKNEQPFSTTDCTFEMPIRYADKGVMSEAENPARTVGQMFKMAIANSGDKIAFAVERPTPAKLDKTSAPSLPWDQWTKWTWSQYHEECEDAAKGFIKQGMPMFGAVSVWGFNSPEWIMTAMGAALAGGKTAGIYPTDSAENVLYKIKQSSSSVMVAESQKQLDVLITLFKDLPELKTVVIYDTDTKIEEKTIQGVEVITWKTLISRGKAAPRAELENRYAKTKPGHCMDLVYTSGTTGQPKAVMISHDNAIANSVCALKGVANMMSGEQRVISYLPLSHVAGFLFDIMFPIMCTALHKDMPATVYFARKYDLSDATIRERLTFIQPTMFLGVPRVWEKIAEAMKAVGAKTKPPLKWISDWAKGTVLEHSTNCQMGGSGEYPACYGIANGFLGKVRQKVGFGSLQVAITGAAPIMQETLDYWGSLGVRIYEVFGMSETTGLATLNSLSGCRFGSVGYAAEGIEVTAFHIDDKGNKSPIKPVAVGARPTEQEQGEICFRGRNVMMGYMGNPKLGSAHVNEIKKKTAEAIDPEGWMHSGDKGCIDVDGMFRITGRYKELIITAGGENIAPVPIEDWIKSKYNCISNLMMVGDKKKYNTCLISLKCVGATGQEPGTTKLLPAVVEQLGCETIEEAMKSAKVKEYLEGALKAANSNPQVVPSNACKIQKYTLLPIDFSVTGEEFTPTLKLKRSYVMDKYAKLIDAMY